MGDPGSIPGSGRSPGEGNGNPLHYSCLENPMDRGAWQATVHRVAKSRTRLSDFTSLQWLSNALIFVTPRTAARQTCLSITNSRSLLKLMSIESVILSNYLILCRPLLLLPPIFPSIQVFSNESALCIRCWSFSFNISSSKEHPGLISFREIQPVHPKGNCKYNYTVIYSFSSV